MNTLPKKFLIALISECEHGKGIIMFCSKLAIALVLCIAMAACGGGGDRSDSETQPDTLVGTLEQFGVDTEQTPRLDNQGSPYPDSYSPMGTIVSMRLIPDADELDGEKLIMGRTKELFLGGYRPDGRPGMLTVADDLLTGSKSADGFTTPELLFELSEIDVPWALERNPFNRIPPTVLGSRRDAISADLNGNGFLETAVAYFVEFTSGASEVRLRVTDGNTPAPSEIDVAIAVSEDFFPVYDLRIANGDFDGDLIDELAIALSRVPDPAQPDTLVGIYIIDDEAAGFTIMREHRVSLDTTFDSPSVTLVIEDARLDHDATSELVLVTNENIAELGELPGSFATQYFVFEVIQDQLSLLSGGPISIDVEGTNHTAVVASVSAGDIDGDRVDEIVFAGLEDVISNCSKPPPIMGQEYVLIGIGNKLNKFSPVGGGALELSIPNCDESENFVLRFTHVNVLDFDGDGDTDIHVNNFVFDNLPGDDTAAITVAELPDEVLVDQARLGFGWFDRSVSAMTVGDQTGDGVDDIITLLMNVDKPYISVWGCCTARETRVSLNPDDMEIVASLSGPNTSHVNPIIISPDVDNDDVILFKYAEEHILDFTEPVVLAAMAAPPCEFGIGQNTDACAATWGSATSAQFERTYNVTASASISGGVGFAGGGVDFEMKGTWSFAASKETSESYEITRSQTFETGPLEDSVVFTVLPIDRYTYNNIAHHDPTQLGAVYTVDLPRSITILIASRDFYNATVQEDALQIDDRVFEHVPGRISSYPTASLKDSILAREKSQLEDFRLALVESSRFDLVEALGGLEVGPVSVGEGSGATELALEYVEVEGESNSLELGYEFEVEVAFGALFGFSVGLSRERTLSVSHGDSSTYSGTIGSIDADNFADNRYRFGLFTYIQALEGQEFEVLNFWTEQD